MKYLRTFENFEAHDEEELRPTAFDMELDATEEDEMQDEFAQDEDEEEGHEEEAHEEVTLEKKKLPAGLKAYLDKKKKGGAAKKTTSKAKPDFLDLDKDGDKKESMKKAAKEAKAKKK